MQLVCVGILGEDPGRIYREVKRRPLYLVKERLGFPSSGRRVRSATAGAVERPLTGSDIESIEGCRGND